MMKAPLLSFFRSCAVTALMIYVSTGFSANVFVAPNGNDSQNGDESHPLKTLITAIQHTLPGDTIWLRAGRYDEGEVWVQNKSMGGQSRNYKTIRGYPGEQASLGGNRRLINQADWIRYVDLHFRLPYTFDNHDGDHVQVLNCTFEGPQPPYGAITFQGSHGLIQGNLIRITQDSFDTKDHGIYLLHGSNNTLRGNTILQPSGYGIHIYDEPKSEDPAGWTRKIHNILVEANHVEGSRHRSGLIATSSGSASVTKVCLRGNIANLNNHVGIIIDHVSDVQCLNNTLYANGRQGLHISSQASQVQIRSNLFVQIPELPCAENCSWYIVRHVFVANPTSDTVVDHNFYSPPPDDLDSLRRLDPNFHTGTPRFIDPANGDFRVLNNNSICDGSGFFGALSCVADPDQIRQSITIDSDSIIWSAWAHPGSLLILESTDQLKQELQQWIEVSQPIRVTSVGANVIFDRESNSGGAHFLRAVRKDAFRMLTPKSERCVE